MMCLVLAMSGTSALLGWIDRPSLLAGRTSRLASSAPTPGAHPLSLQQIESFVQSVVAEASNLRPARWESVDVLAGPAASEPAAPAYPNSMLLAAEPNRAGRAGKPTVSVGLPTQFHFRIDPQGRPFATDAWIRQVALAKDPNAIAIQVTRPGERQPMTPSQWQCVRSLISELSSLRQSRQADSVNQQAGIVSRVAATASMLPMRLHEDWSKADSTTDADDRS